MSDKSAAQRKIEAAEQRAKARQAKLAAGAAFLAKMGKSSAASSAGSVSEYLSLEESEEEQLKKAIAMSLESAGDAASATAASVSAKSKKKEEPVDTNCGPAPWKAFVSESKAWETRYSNAATTVPGMNNLCVRECGAGGDCMFYAVAKAVEMLHPQALAGIKSGSDQMMAARGWLADSITVDNIEDFMHAYQAEKFTNPRSWPAHPGTWKPETFGSMPGRTLMVNKKPMPPIPVAVGFEKHLDENHPQFHYYLPPDQIPAGMAEAQRRRFSIRTFMRDVIRAMVKTAGYTFQGDTLALEYMVNGPTPLRRFGIGFIVLSRDGYIECQVYPAREARDVYVPLYWLGNHWQLAGVAVAKNQVQIAFPRQDLPDLFKILYSRDCGGVLEVLQ